MSKITKFTYLLITLMVITACKKDDLTTIDDRLTETTNASKDYAHITNYGGSQKSHRSGTVQTTILGALRENPYTIELMTQAWNTLYPNDQVTTLPTTHRYVKFTPQTLEELKTLTETDYFFYDYPLEYEVIHLGEYYEDPAQGKDDIPFLYAILEEGEPIPNVPHEILANLFLAPYESLLTAKAFEITENEYDYEAIANELYNNGSNNQNSGMPEGGCLPECPNYPDCLFDPNIDCGDGGGNTGGSSGGGSGTNNTPPCTPSSPTFPDCLMVQGTVGSTTLSTTTTNACGCLVYDNPRKPGGCIRVEDTQLPNNSTVVANHLTHTTRGAHMTGVRNVEVTFKDGWFSEESTFTDHNGCFKIDKRLYGEIHRHVKFKSDEITIRGLRNWNIFNYALAIKTNKMTTFSTPLNGIQINYLQSTNPNALATLYYEAATMNNSLYEYNDMAVQLGIGKAPDDVDVLLTSWVRTGGAPMLDEIFKDPDGNLSAIPTGFIGVMLPLTANGAPIPVTATVGVIVGTLSYWAPDVFIGYNSANVNSFRSDLRKTWHYHELAHTTHYESVGSPYWEANIGHTIDVAMTNLGITMYGQIENWVFPIAPGLLPPPLPLLPSPYGDGNQPGSDRCEVIETWGYHIESTFTDMRYGLNHSRGNSPSLERRRHIYALEEEVYWDNANQFIPEGLIHDLIDDNANNPIGAPNWDLNNGINDNIRGFTHNQIYLSLTPNVESIPDLRDVINNDYLSTTNNTLADYNILFLNYGY